MLAGKEWWEGVPVGKVLVLVGEDEILRDSTSEWVGNFKTHNLNTKIVVGKGECHTQPLIDLALGSKSSGEQSKVLDEWLVKELWG